MTDLLTPPAEAAVTGQGYGVRALPLPLYVRAHAAALVPLGHVAERLDLTAADIPVLDVAVAADEAGAALRLAASAARSRLARAGESADTGAAADHDEAVAQAIYAGLARRRPHPGTIEDVRTEGIRIADCEPARAALRGTGGRIDCYLLGESASVPVIGAVLRLPRLGRPLHAQVCDLDLRRGVRRAVHAVLRRLTLATLAGPETDTAPPPHDIGTIADFGDIVETGVIAHADLAAGPAPGTEAALLRAALAGHGLRARVRTLSPAGAGITVVACRIAPADVDAGDAADADGPVPPAPAVVVVPTGLRAPRQLSLTYRPADVRLSRIFHENSKMRTGFGTLPAVDVNDMAPAARRLIGQAYRDFRDAARSYDLGTDGRPADLAPLDQCVRRRRSWAPMGGGALSRDQLAHLLGLSYGTTGSGLAGGDVRLPLRATPSAGGLYSCDLFLLVNRVTGIEPGLYYLQPGRQVLQLVRADRTWAEVTAQTGYRDRADQAAAMVIYTGAFRRNQWKYRERGYRTVLLDCGHLAQSVVLTATALGLVAHPMIAFIDDYFNDLVGVDGVDDAVLYLTLLGPRSGPRSQPEETA
ncbi:SagB-type dehydrogenase domain-containing protein [Streptomyces sp. yr375]|uniref:SagB/ThcOx family dehydrogenase n=1 Tax=Streptomyces sp. yr375 TaxID=1761906 RepID=UPI0008C67F48|nr:SagB/ThcOx family dehydrogenase [Streptomyces sp. yr375]SER48176.1 SagB-type dehydrogenase domain-containing protein [Streptomyces sp. yr375]